jgi:bacterioferritin
VAIRAHGAAFGDSHQNELMAPITKEQLIALLNEDLAREYQAVITYRTYASAVPGLQRQELREFFASEIPDELGHAEILADKIVAMGGQPETVPAKVKYTDDPRQMVENALADEEETVNRYVERREQAEACGEFGLAVQFDDLIADETKHRDELRMMLRRWG